MMRIDQEAIIFDFGGVLINIDYNATLCAFQALGLNDFQELFNQAIQVDLFNRFEKGDISSQRFINALLDYLPQGTTPNKVVEAWNAMILDVPAQGIQLLEELKAKGKRLFLLSNTNDIHIQLAWNNWKKVSNVAPDDIFDKIYLSHELHMRKPHADIFDLVCQEQNLNPNDTIFIDDSIQHIEGAKKMGLQTYHLQKIEELYSLFS